MLILKDVLIGKKVKRIHPSHSTPNSHMIQGEIYTITDTTVKKPRRVTL